MKQAPFSRLKGFKAAIALTGLLVFSYFAFSQGNLFLGKNMLLSLSFSFSRPLSLVLYMFAHISPWHLAANAVMLGFFAAIVEKSLSSRDVFGIFLLCGILTASLFSYFNPAVALVGASAGTVGLMAAAFVLDLKKTVAVLAFAAGLYLLLFSGISLAIEGKENSLASEAETLERDLNKAIESGDTEMVRIIVVKKDVVQRQIVTLEEGKETASGVDIDPFIHSYAGIFGIAYILLFRRKETLAAVKRQKESGFFGLKKMA